MRTLTPCLIALATAAASCNAQGPLSQAAFRDAVAQEMSNRRPDLCVRASGESGLNIGRSADACNEVQISTDYLYRQYASDPTQQSLYVDRLVTMALNGVAELEGAAVALDRTRLVAVLRPDAYASTLGARGDRESSIWQPFVGDFIVVLAQYDEGQIRSIRGIDLEEINLTESEAWNLAGTNLRGHIGSMERTQNEAGAELITASSGLAPAYLLLPDTCTARGPDFYAYVAARDSLFYADAAKPEATAMLASYAAQMVQGSEVYSHRLLSCIDGAWYASIFNGSGAWLPEQQSDH